MCHVECMISNGIGDKYKKSRVVMDVLVGNEKQNEGL